MNGMADQEQSRRTENNIFTLKVQLCKNSLFNDRHISGMQLASRHDDHFHVSIAME